MTAIFFTVLRISFIASYLIAAAILVRFPLGALFKNVPKNAICLLWLIVGLRLACPVIIESPFSLVPGQSALSAALLLDNNHAALPANAAPTNQEQGAQDTRGQAQNINGQAQNANGQDAENIRGQKRPAQKNATENTFANTLESQSAPRSQTSAIIERDFLQALRNPLPARIWCAGMSLMCAYLLFSMYRIKKNVAVSVPDEWNGIRFYRCETIATPFLFGIVAPKIYVPYTVSQPELPYVLMHEKAHRMRYDHLAKIAGYTLLSIYWFHPLVWAAYILLCQDIELACDEKVVKDVGMDCKQAYSKALLACCANKKAIATCPVAFAEIGVKKRVNNILQYKKPGLRAVLAAAAACIAISVCFATESKRDPGRLNAGTMQKTDAGRLSHSETPDDTRAIDFLEQWAGAYCSRDADAVAQMLRADAKKAFFSDTGGAADDANHMDAASRSFGWSSPWPWAAGTIGKDNMPNYNVLSAKDGTAEILYYAWTSDPHVTVWRQSICYEPAGKEEKQPDSPPFLITKSSIRYFDQIADTAAFASAYPHGIRKTPIDYTANAAGKALNRNAKQNRKLYKKLFRPVSAARFLLNITTDTSKVSASTTVAGSQATVTFTFQKDGSAVTVNMLRPYGKKGIWLPQF